MIDIFLKHLFIIFCSSIITFKLIKKSISPIFIAFLIIYDILVGLAVTLLQVYMPILSVFANVMLLLCINKFVYKLNIHKSMEYTVIGTAVSYLLYIISLFAYLILAVFFSLIKLPKTIIPASIIVGIFQLIMSFLIFKIKRFSKGLPFLSITDNSTDFDVYISTFILCIIILLNADFEEIIAISFFMAVLVIFGLFLIFWWRHRTNNIYKAKLHNLEIEKLTQKINLLEAEISNLKQENEMFSKLIHKDNKLVPAMLFSVEELLSSIKGQDDSSETSSKAEKLLKELKLISAERIGIIENCERNTSKSISTNIKRLDILLFYMQNKAKNMGIMFDIINVQTIDISEFKRISEDDFSTLLADLCENAIIAVERTNNSSKKICVDMGCKDNSLYISIFDTAEPFSDEVISNFGKHRYTTHQNSGGSGIGLMSVYEICQKYGASFYIKNLSQKEYTKSVSVVFNNKDEFIVK